MSPFRPSHMIGADIYGLSAALVGGWAESAGDHYVLRAVSMDPLKAWPE